jgi:hypothetical protein
MTRRHFYSNTSEKGVPQKINGLRIKLFRAVRFAGLLFVIGENWPDS